jgi:hypothetical protein
MRFPVYDFVIKNRSEFFTKYPYVFVSIINGSELYDVVADGNASAILCIYLRK